MSDRPQGSVRTEARVGEAAAKDGSRAGAAPASGQQPVARQQPAPGQQPASATQSIPTGGVRAQAQASAAPAAPAPASAAPAPASAAPAPASPTAVPAAPAGSAPAGGAHAAGAPAGRSAATSRPREVAGRAGAKPGRGPRRARLQLRHIDTWSAFKISFVLAVALFFIWMVAIGILYGVLSGLGVFNTVNDLFGQLGSASGSKSSGAVITPGIVLGGAAVIGAINIILMTALCTVATFIYNMCADLVGGLEVTLSERD
jgi:Transmembrane domain of unknown function (DUF3566)